MTTLLTVPSARFRLRKGRELLEQCGPWRLCGTCGTTLFFEADHDTVSALASTVNWPGQNLDDLHSVAKYGNPGLRRLIHRGLPLEARDYEETPLMLATGNGKLRAARILLQHGASAESAVESVACSWLPAMHRLFLDAGVDRQTLFSSIARYGRVRDARSLLGEGVDVNLPNAAGYRPLYRAAWNSTGMVRFLLSRGADPNFSNLSGRNAAGLCAFRGYLKRLGLLVTAGLTVDILEEAIVAACQGGRRKCFELLVESGAAVNQQDFTPLMAAAEKGSVHLKSHDFGLEGSVVARRYPGRPRRIRQDAETVRIQTGTSPS